MRSNSRPISSSKQKQRRPFAAPHGGERETDGNQRFAGAGRSDDQRARAGRDPAAKQRIKFGNTGRNRIARHMSTMFGRHEPRENIQAARGDGDIVEAAPVFLSPILEHPHAAAFGAIGGRQLLQLNHAMRDAVHGLVCRIRGQIVQQQYRGTHAREMMLDGQDLSPIAQRALRQQTDLRQAVDHQARRLDVLDGREDARGGLRQLKIRGVQQALLLASKQRLGGDQFLHQQVAFQAPAVRGGARAQFVRSLRQGDVQTAFTLLLARQQKLQRDRRLAAARLALQQENAAAGQPARQHVVEAPNPGRCLDRSLGGVRGVRVHCTTV